MLRHEDTLRPLDRPRCRLAAKPVSRREARSLLQRPADDDFSGVGWDYLANGLAAYAVPVLMSWTRTGKIRELCALKGRPIRSAPPDWTYEDRSSVVTMTVAVALDKFRDRVLRQGAWDSEAGASLTTYFMGAVILQYPNQFNRWLNDRLRVRDLPGLSPVTEAQEHVILISPRSDIDPARAALNLIYLAEVLDNMPPTLADACRLMYTGHTQREAAEAAGRAEGALSQQLRRYRDKKKREENPG